MKKKKVQQQRLAATNFETAPDNPPHPPDQPHLRNPLTLMQVRGFNRRRGA
jgi:hypothetical protein